MSPELNIKFANINERDSNYQWVNIDLEKIRVGKARISKYYSKIIIHTINIFPEYQKKGFAAQLVDLFKEKCPEIIAENVRPTAREFWKCMGFHDRFDGNYGWTYSGGKAKSE